MRFPGVPFKMLSWKGIFIPSDGNVVIRDHVRVNTCVGPPEKASHVVKELITFSLQFSLLETIPLRVFGPTKPWKVFGDLNQHAVYIGIGMECPPFPQ